MTINKFQGKTQEEAIAKAKEEFGERAVIMNIREVKPKGLFRAFKNSTFEVTAAMEEKEHFSNAMQAAQMTQSMAKEGKLHDMINLAADEPITIPKLQEQEGNAQATRQEPARMPQSQNMTQDNEGLRFYLTVWKNPLVGEIQRSRKHQRVRLRKNLILSGFSTVRC